MQSRQHEHEQFQSAPLTDVRGDPSTNLVVRARNVFQSAPLTDVRGDDKIIRRQVDSHTSFNPLPSRM